MPSINTNTFSGPSFSLNNRLMRSLWIIICALFFRFSPRPFHAWRAFLLRLFGAQLGSQCHIYPSAKIWAPWNLKMANSSCIGDNVLVYNQAIVSLGEKAVISQNVHLCTGTHDYNNPGFPLIAYPIIIGAYAWICADCFIAPGTDIGEGCVVAVRSVVIKSLPAWNVCAGHPCIPKKPRQKPF